MTRLCTALTLTLLAGAAFAQDSKPQPPLRGPAVRDGGVPGENRPFGTGAQKRKESVGGEFPNAAFARAFDVLRGEKADAATRLTSDQDAQLRKIAAAFKATAQAYREKHGEEVKGLLGKLPPEDRRRAEQMLRRPEAARPGQRPDKGKRPESKPDDAMQEVDPQEASAARERLRELFEQAPKPAETHARMFAVLTDAQRPLVQKAIETTQAERKNRAEKPREMNPGDGKTPTIDDPRIPERLRERIKKLPPDQQEEALKRAVERLKERNPK